MGVEDDFEIYGEQEHVAYAAELDAWDPNHEVDQETEDTHDAIENLMGGWEA